MLHKKMSIRNQNESRRVLNLNNWLTQYRVDTSSKEYTHIRGCNPRTKWNIPEHKIDTFFDLYCNCLKNGEFLSIQEHLPTVTCLVTDVDLQSSIDFPHRQYKEHHIKKIIRYYHKVIRETFKAEDIQNEHLYCILFEKPAPRVKDNNTFSDGFHLMFPNICYDSTVLRKAIQSKVHSYVIQQKIFTKTNYKKIEVEDTHPNTFWMLYGSGASVEKGVYKYTVAYDQNMDKIPLRQIFGDKRPSGKHSLRRWLPKLLSMRGKEATVEINDNTKKFIKLDAKHKRNKKYINVDETIDPETVLTNIRVASELLPMINKKRADDYREWMEMGWLLFCVGAGCEDALNLWIEFSRQSSKYEEGQCYELWDNMENRGKTLKDLRYLAQKDSPLAYRDWENDGLSTILEDAMKRGTDGGVAEVLHAKYSTTFVCVNISKNVWYTFKGHRWHKSEEANDLYLKLTKDVRQMYIDLQMKYYNLRAVADDYEKGRLENYIKLIDKLLYGKTKSLDCDSFCMSIIKRARHLFYDPEFLKRADDNNYINGMTNGVFIAGPDEAYFRDGRPDDYVTMCTNIPFRHFSAKSKAMRMVKDFIRKLFPNPALRDYTARFLASILIAGNKDKTFQVWTGGSNNGKSTLEDLIVKTFGDYCKKLPTSLVTGKRGASGAASPELERMKGVRITFLQEPNKGDNLNVGIVKEITGNTDTTYVRGLFKDGFDLRFVFKIVLTCNDDLPNLPATDKGAWNRVRVVPFEVEFVDEHLLPKSKKERKREKKEIINREFEEQIPSMTEAFFYYLATVYLKEYKERKLDPPKEVMEASSEYRSCNDFYSAFIEDNVDTDASNEAEIVLKEFYTSFKSWFKDNFPNRSKSVPDLPEVKKYLKKRWGTPINIDGSVGWKGKCLIEDKKFVRSNGDGKGDKENESDDD